MLSVTLQSKCHIIVKDINDEKIKSNLLKQATYIQIRMRLMSEQQQWQVKRIATHLQCAETKVNLKLESQLSFKNEDRIKTFSEKHKLQEFTATDVTAALANEFRSVQSQISNVMRVLSSLYYLQRQDYIFLSKLQVKSFLGSC